MSDVHPVRDELAESNPEALLVGAPEESYRYDRALVGVARRCGQPDLAVYDHDRLVACFAEQGLEYEKAEEHVLVNVMGSWLGEHTPVILTRYPGDAPFPGERAALDLFRGLSLPEQVARIAAAGYRALFPHAPADAEAVILECASQAARD